MKNRRRAREAALQILYEVDVRKVTAEKVLETTFSRYRFKPEIKKFVRKLVLGTYQFLPPINSLIKKYAKNWTLERMATVDRNILRLSIYELLLLDDIPPVVSINEAVEIAKRYGTADSGKFVNGILDKISKERSPNSSLKWAYLKKSLKKDLYLKKLIEIKGKEKIWLVGGCLRNLLLGKEKKDLDLIEEDPDFKTAQLFAQSIKRSLITLRPTLRRITLPSGIAIDFALKNSAQMQTNLIKRDFTINALSLDIEHLELSSLFLIDPSTGLEDLINKKIKLMRKESIEEDPLRMLRAFRLAAQFNFIIEENLSSLIQQKSIFIKNISVERVREEIFLLLESPLSYKYMDNLSSKTLLKKILEQNPNIESLKRLEEILSSNKIIPRDIKKRILLHLKKNNQGKKSRKSLLKLIALLFSPEEKIPLSSVGKQLKLTQKQIKTMKKIEKVYPDVEKIMKEEQLDPLLVAQFLIEAGKETVETLLLFLTVNFKRSSSQKSAIFLLQEYFQKSSLLLQSPGLIKGKELMELLGISAGPQIAYILNKIHQAQVAGKINTKEKAINFAKKLIQ
ncbi:MAG: transcription antitermination factor NusB [Candidatus Aerophobetes bacterium]|nr:transcription antitermination factor NusB [Candidatus Aerophobetes bacterium]